MIIYNKQYIANTSKKQAEFKQQLRALCALSVPARALLPTPTPKKTRHLIRCRVISNGVRLAVPDTLSLVTADKSNIPDSR